MKLQAVMLLLGSSLFLASCGDDQATRGRGAPGTGPVTPAIESSEAANISAVSRERGSPQITYNSEASVTGNAYRFVPDMSRDAESGMNVSRTSLGRPNTFCGIGENLTSLSARVADCEIKNQNLSLWSAKNHGTSAEANWTLVAFTTEGLEIWQDQKTKALWSYIVGKGNWCQAAGNSQSPEGIITVDCATSIPADEAASLCFGIEIAGLENLVQWRLPTRGDYLQADIDGLRSVMPTKDLDSNGLWTATMDSTSMERSKAWVYGQKQGTLSSDSLLTSHQVRCIGTPK